MGKRLTPLRTSAGPGFAAPWQRRHAAGLLSPPPSSESLWLAPITGNGRNALGLL